MKILILGSGGREHALVRSLLDSKDVKKIFLYPGNAGIKKEHPEIELVDLKNARNEDLIQFCKGRQIDLTIVGPEVYLQNGIVNDFTEQGLKIFGPTKEAAQLETSKIFAKNVMNKAGVKTASFAEFEDLNKALDYIEHSDLQMMVVKADGLAQGKGVVVCHSKQEARCAVEDFLSNRTLGFKVNRILIEEFLTGRELSVFAICSDEQFVILGSACDYKQLYDGGKGPNTGGMGSLAPCYFLTKEDEKWIGDQIFSPVLKQMKSAQTPFRGVLFAGLIKNDSGFYVLEFNVRFGDPETQSLLPLVDEDLLPWFEQSALGQMPSGEIKLKDQKAVHVVLAASGYPGINGQKILSGSLINVDQEIKFDANHLMFWAGVEKPQNALVTKGGRILGITTLASTYAEARKATYRNINLINFEKKQFRTDIGQGIE